MNLVSGSRRKGNCGRDTAGKAPVTGDGNNIGISEISVFQLTTHLFYLDYMETACGM
jgi:hypothetical protein